MSGHDQMMSYDQSYSNWSSICFVSCNSVFFHAYKKLLSAPYPLFISLFFTITYHKQSIVKWVVADEAVDVGEAVAETALLYLVLQRLAGEAEQSYGVADLAVEVAPPVEVVPFVEAVLPVQVSFPLTTFRPSV